jgi:aspartate kinase
MQVFKFGGASVNSVERIKKLGDILRLYPGEKILVVISAMGKTTNALEKVTEAFFNKNQPEALRLFNEIKQQHLSIASQLLKKPLLSLNDLFTEIEWLLHDHPARDFDYYYDQVVCIGELLSTTIVSAYLNENGMASQWLDVRDIFRTDDNFRDATIDWNFTQAQVDNFVKPLFNSYNIVLTQGFIGATDENESTTLGREGSDYSAAVFANMLDAESLTIWKDVKGIMNADPKLYSDAQLISEMDYTEVIEMAYYGAQVIHPKTIKPLQNKLLPLYVKCFVDPLLPGTGIKQKAVKDLPPIVIIKTNQVMITMQTKDFSFMGEKPVGELYNLFEEMKVKPSLTQNTAISFICVMDDKPDKIEKLKLEASASFNVTIRKNLTLFTMRHYNEAVFQPLIKEKSILLRQQTPETVQVLIAE